MTFATPAPGERLTQPPFENWEAAARENGAALTPLAPLRDAIRRAALETAERYTRRLGLPVQSAAADAPLVMAGHQPSFYHPGVLYKYRLLAEAAARGMAAINLNVDTDPSEGFLVKVPSYANGEYRRVAHYAAPGAANMLYMDASAREDEVAAFAENVLRDLRALPERLFSFGEVFVETEMGRELPPMMADAMVHLRRVYTAHWPRGVLELPLSELCRAAPFFTFAFEMLARAPEAAAIFNDTLAAYRAEHGIRSKANPFPDLATDAQTVETLFWIGKEGVRLPLSVVMRGGCPALLLDGAHEMRDAAMLREFCQTRKLRLWPRAVALSVLNRLFVADLFVHGTGGAKYDRITDIFVSRFHGIVPPPFAVASATLKLPGLDDPAPELAALRQRLRETAFHPENFLENAPPELVAEKRSLRAAIAAPGADKKGIGKRISEINAELNGLMGPVIHGLERRIAAAEKELGRYEALADREFPYFLYPPTAIPPP
ncbi:MAG: hypothetical protein HZA03_09915 [Nitrospinae bacterium]|nr:hypothetical protein [Nitrospinota bacterium]